MTSRMFDPISGRANGLQGLDYRFVKIQLSPNVHCAHALVRPDSRPVGNQQRLRDLNGTEWELLPPLSVVVTKFNRGRVCSACAPFQQALATGRPGGTPPAAGEGGGSPGDAGRAHRRPGAGDRPTPRPPPPHRGTPRIVQERGRWGVAGVLGRRGGGSALDPSGEAWPQTFCSSSRPSLWFCSSLFQFQTFYLDDWIDASMDASTCHRLDGFHLFEPF